MMLAAMSNACKASLHSVSKGPGRTMAAEGLANIRIWVCNSCLLIQSCKACSMQLLIMQLLLFEDGQIWSLVKLCAYIYSASH